MTRLMFAALATVFALCATAAAAPVRTDNVEAELHTARAVVAPGERFLVALRQTIRPGWHTYWRNPGDSGAPTEIAWRLPEGYSAGPIQWPAPKPIPVGPLVNYGFEGEVLLPVEITAPADAKLGPAAIEAHASWLVCSDICIPEEAELSLPLMIGPAGRDDSAWTVRLAAAAANAPKRGAIEARLSRSGQGFLLTATGAPLQAAGPAYFFPFAGDAIDHAAAQSPQAGPAGVSLTLTAVPGSTLGKGPLAGVLAVGEGATRRAFEIEAAPGAPLTGTSGTIRALGGETNAPGSGIGLLAALALAFAGGLLLNVMPCVLPVLSIKALSLAQAPDAAVARRHGVLFTLGVLATFLVLAAVLIGLTAAGAAVGWGFQLQEPLVVAALALLFFALGLNLLGVFEVGGAVQNLGGGLAGRSGGAGAFFTGALAVVTATPCTAPFMGAATGFAALQPAPVALAVFLALGLGFAAPFAALSFAPALRRLLPKPGPWMDRFKQLLAFPLLGAAGWLISVLAAQTGSGGVLGALAALVAFAFAVWALRATRSTTRRAAAGGLAVIVILVAAAMIVRAPQAAAGAPVAGLPGEAWSGARLAALRAQGRPVFVNFTADWCVTCKANEVAVASADVRAAMEATGAAYLVGDWTRRDAAIAAELKAHGRAGVPLYLLYPAGELDAAPRVLPQILTPGALARAIRDAGASSPPQGDAS